MTSPIRDYSHLPPEQQRAIRRQAGVEAISGMVEPVAVFGFLLMGGFAASSGLFGLTGWLALAVGYGVVGLVIGCFVSVLTVRGLMRPTDDRTPAGPIKALLKAVLALLLTCVFWAFTVRDILDSLMAMVNRVGRRLKR